MAFAAPRASTALPLRGRRELATCALDQRLHGGAGGGGRPGWRPSPCGPCAHRGRAAAGALSRVMLGLGAGQGGCDSWEPPAPRQAGPRASGAGRRAHCPSTAPAPQSRAPGAAGTQRGGVCHLRGHPRPTTPGAPGGESLAEAVPAPGSPNAAPGSPIAAGSLGPAGAPPLPAQRCPPWGHQLLVRPPPGTTAPRGVRAGPGSPCAPPSVPGASSRRRPRAPRDSQRLHGAASALTASPSAPAGPRARTPTGRDREGPGAPTLHADLTPRAPPAPPPPAGPGGPAPGRPPPRDDDRSSARREGGYSRAQRPPRRRTGSGRPCPGCILRPGRQAWAPAAAASPGRAAAGGRPRSWEAVPVAAPPVPPRSRGLPPSAARALLLLPPPLPPSLSLVLGLEQSEETAAHPAAAPGCVRAEGGGSACGRREGGGGEGGGGEGRRLHQTCQAPAAQPRRA